MHHLKKYSILKKDAKPFDIKMFLKYPIVKNVGRH